MKVKLGDIFEISSGGTPSKSCPEYYGGDVPWVKTGDLKSEYIYGVADFITEDGLRNSSAKMYEEDTVLMAMYGATIGATSILKISACTNQACAAFRRNDKVIPEYLYYFLKSQKEKFVKDGVGGAQPNISAGYLKKVEMELLLIKEQRIVVDILDKITNIINRRNQELIALDELIKARFVEMFGDNDKKVAISSLCDVSGGYSFKSEDISSKGFIKILQIGNVYLDDVNWETTNYLPKGFDNVYSRFLLNEGDIVIALTRPIIQSLGNVKACIVKASDTPCLLNQRVGRIVSKKNVDVNLKFIYGCLMTDDFTRYVESCCIGCSQPNISTKDIENYMIPDASYEKKMDFVKFKEQVDKSKVAVQKALDETQLLFDSLMQQYFG